MGILSLNTYNTDNCIYSNYNGYYMEVYRTLLKCSRVNVVVPECSSRPI